jgi:hypothetical protein
MIYYCWRCNKEFKRAPSDYKKYERSYCSKSCYRKDKIDLYTRYKKQFNRLKDNRRGIKEIEVTLQDLHQQWLKQNGRCSLTNEILKFGATEKERKTGFTTASLDRKDNEKGYLKDNIQWVHKDVNDAKGKLTQQRFIEICKEVTLHEFNQRNLYIPEELLECWK